MPNTPHKNQWHNIPNHRFFVFPQLTSPTSQQVYQRMACPRWHQNRESRRPNVSSYGAMELSM